MFAHESPQFLYRTALFISGKKRYNVGMKRTYEKTFRGLMVAALLAAMILGALSAYGEVAALQSGDKGEAVRDLQKRLAALGDYSGKADGIYGPITAEAVSAFQKRAGLAPTGEADEKTQSALFSDAALLLPRAYRQGDKGEAVRRLQLRLIAYGLLSGEADGAFGKSTAAAVKKLEGIFLAQGVGAKADGELSVEEYKAFYAEGFSLYQGDYAPGDSGEGVTAARERLNALNYTDVSPAPLLDAQTAMALRVFQNNNGLPVTGSIDRATMDALCAPDAISAQRALRRALTSGDSGRTVLEMKERLAVFGFLDAVPNDQFDTDARQALSRFLSHREALGTLAPKWSFYLSGDEVAGTTFQTALLDQILPVYVAQVKEGDRGEQVARVQRRLYALYYLGNGSMDGRAGKATVAAISAFQKENQLPETGVADRLTQWRLFSPDARTNPMPYLVKVSLDDQRVYVYSRGSLGLYTPVREMICSTGLNNSTPRGVFLNTTPQDRWHYFKKFVCWAQYTYIIYGAGDILFHSVIYNAPRQSALNVYSLHNLGTKASHGCVRLTVEDAKWLFDNCEKGTPVVIY